MGLKSTAGLKLAGGALAVLCMLSLSGCSSSNGANVVTVTISSSAGLVLILGQSTNLTANVSGATNEMVTWSSLQYTTTTTTNGTTTTSKPQNAPSDGSFGVLSNTNPGNASTGGGTAIYTAPDPTKFQLPDQTKFPGLQIVITATSQQTSSKSGTINITLTSGIRSTLQPGSASVPTGEQQQFLASLTNDVQNKAVTWLLTQNVTTTTNGVTNTVPQLPTCSPTCGTITPDANNPNVAVYTAPSTVPTAITPAQSSTINPGANTPQNLTIVATPNADNTGFVTGTITITMGGPITFNGITPTLAPQGATLWDIYLDAPNISSSSQILLTYPNSAPVVKNSASGQIKILFPLPPPPCTGTSCSTTTTTPPPSTGARLRLNATDLATSGTVSVSVVDLAQPCNSLAVGTPCTATGITSFNILPVRPTSTASVPDDVVQGKLAQQAHVIINGGYFGPNGKLAAPFFQGNVIVQDQNNPSSSRQLNALMSTNQINQGNPGLYPLSVIGNATSPPPPPSVTNIAVFPDYSGTPPQVVGSGIAAGTNPGAIDVDTSLGVAVVAETGSNGVQFYAIAKGTLTPIDSTGATCAAACPVTSQTFPNVLINTPTGLSVNRTNHTVAIVNYGNQSVTVLPIPVPGAAAQTPAPGTPFTVDISGALQGAVSPAPIPYSIGVDPDSNMALVAYSSTAFSTSQNLGFIVNLNPNTATNPYGCIVGQAINGSSNQFGQCLSAQVTMNNCAYPQIATAPHGHLALATPGGISVQGVGGCAGGVVRGVDVTKPSTSNVIQSATLTSGLVTVTIDPTQCPPPLANPNPSATPPTNPCPFSMVPGNAGTVLITGVKPTNSANDAFFNGNFSVQVTSNNSFQYALLTNTTANDTAQGGCQTSGASKTCATVFYGPPNLTIQITQSLQGVAINPITSTVAMADANSTNVPIDLLNALDQSVSSIGVSATCTAYTTSCSSAPELLRTTAVAWQPYTNQVVSYNPNLNQVSISDPVSRQRYAFACELNATTNTKPNAGTTCITDPSTAPTTVCPNLSACQQMFLNQITLLGTGTANLNVTNGTTGSLTLWGGVAVDPATNQAFVLMSGSGTIDIIDLGGPNNLPSIAIPIKPTHVSEIIVPSPTGAVGTIGGIPNALVPQATLTCVPPPGSPAGTCNLSGVKIFGSGFVSGLQVRLDGVDITTQGGVINNIAANGREVDVTIPPFFLSAPHNYALDVLSNGVQSNVVDFIVIQSVDLSKVCTNSSGGQVNTQPSSIAIADQISNGPFSPFGLVSVSGCNSVVKVDLNPASPTFGQLLGSPISVGTTPQGVAISQKLGLAVVANHGTNTVSILDLTQNPAVEKVPDVTTDANPTGVAIDDAIGAAVVANTTANDVSVINLQSLFPPAGTTPPTSLTATNVGGFQQPVAVAIDPDRGTNNQGQAVVTGVTLSSNGSSGALYPVEIGFNPPIPGLATSPGFVPSPPTGIVFDPTVVTGTANPGAFYTNSSGTNTVTQYNPDSGGGSSVNVGVNPTSLAINPQTGAILTSNSGSSTISIVDTLSNPFQTRQTLSLPGSPTFGVAIDQFTNLAVIVDQANMRVLLFPMPH